MKLDRAVGFVFLVGQAVCLEIAASDATTDLKIQWFEALLRQDMAFYDIKDVSSQATVVAASAVRFKRYVDFYFCNEFFAVKY